MITNGYKNGTSTSALGILGRKLKGFAIVAGLASTLLASGASAQGRKSVFQTGEELTYKVKFGFIKLGTVVIKTGPAAPEYGANKVRARMQFATADVPFLDAKSTINDVIDTSGLYIVHFESKESSGDKVTNKKFDYDAAKKTVVYSDDKGGASTTGNINPFSDALTLLFNLRAWAGSGQTYGIPMHNKDGNKSVTAKFTKKTSMEECAALDDKEVRTRVVEGHADMGASAPLGANGDFKIYVSDDAAAIPVKIEMSIAIGSITLELDKVKRAGWGPATALNK